LVNSFSKAPLVLGQTTSNFKLTKLTTARTQKKPPPSPYSILCVFPQDPHPNGLFVQGLPKRSLEIAKVRLSQLCETINLLLKPPIEMRSKAKF